jgi:hypothetical protein
MAEDNESSWYLLAKPLFCHSYQVSPAGCKVGGKDLSLPLFNKKEGSDMKNRLLWLAVLVVSLSSMMMAAEIPRSEEEIPVFPGAVRNPAAERELELEHPWEVQDEMRSSTFRVYTAEASINEVCRFYIDHLGADEGFPPEEPDELMPGESLPPWYGVDPYRSDLFTDQYYFDTLIYDGQWAKSVFSRRDKWEDGSWLASAWFEWMVGLNNGDAARYSVSLEDVGFDPQNKVFSDQTQITIHSLVRKSEEALWDEMDLEMAELALQLADSPPTEQTLGVPLYPGSIFEPDISAGMSLDGGRLYVFLSEDPTSTVAAFYEQHLGESPVQSGESYLFALKGELPIPDEGLTIEPNMFGGAAKTVISVLRQSE